MRRRVRCVRRLVLAALLVAPWLGQALEPGDRVEDVELPSLNGGKVHLLPKGAAVHVLVFAKPGHPHCVEALRNLASREDRLAGVHWVAILPGDSSLAEARALVSTTGIKMPVLLDPGDRLYGRMEVKLQPTIFVVDRDGRVAASEPFREINYGDRVTARIRFTVGEITAAELAEAEDPARSETHSDQGVARSRAQFGLKLMEMGQLEMALTEVQKSLALAPTSLGYVLQGKILARQGKCRDASRAFEVALQMEPKNGEAAAEKVRPCPPKGGRAP